MSSSKTTISFTFVYSVINYFVSMKLINKFLYFFMSKYVNICEFIFGKSEAKGECIIL